MAESLQEVLLAMTHQAQEVEDQVRESQRRRAKATQAQLAVHNEQICIRDAQVIELVKKLAFNEEVIQQKELQLQSAKTQMARMAAQAEEKEASLKDKQLQLDQVQKVHGVMLAKYKHNEEVLQTLLQMSTASSSQAPQPNARMLAELQEQLDLERQQNWMLLKAQMTTQQEHASQIKLMEEQLTAQETLLHAKSVPSQPPPEPMPEPQEQQQPRVESPPVMEIPIHQEEAGPSHVRSCMDDEGQEFMQWERVILDSLAAHLIKPDQLAREYNLPTLPYPLMKYDTLLRQRELLPNLLANTDGSYDVSNMQDEERQQLVDRQPPWRKKWLSLRPGDKLHYLRTPAALQVDPTFCPIRRRRAWHEYDLAREGDKYFLNYPLFPGPLQRQSVSERYVKDNLTAFNELLRDVPDLTCQMMYKINTMLLTALEAYSPIARFDTPFNRFLEGQKGLAWDLQTTPPKPILMGIFSRLMFLPSHFMATFKEAFLTGYFEAHSSIFALKPSDLHTRYVAYQRQELITPLPQILEDRDLERRVQEYRHALRNIRDRAPRPLACTGTCNLLGRGGMLRVAAASDGKLHRQIFHFLRDLHFL